MLLIVKKDGITGGICYIICWYVKVNNKYIKDYDNNKRIITFSV